MGKRILLGFTCVLLGIVFTGCGAKSPEKQQAKWDHTLAEAERVMATNPAFGTVLQAEIDRASQAMADAKQLSDPKQQAQAMAAARKMLHGGVFGRLGRVKSDIQEIRDLTVKAAAAGASESARLAARQAGDNATAVIANVEQQLKAGAEDQKSAIALLDEAGRDLDRVGGTLRTLIRESKQKAKARQSAQKTSGTKVGSNPGAGRQSAPAAPKLWKCAYCGGKNKVSATKCPNCGAARK